MKAFSPLLLLVFALVFTSCKKDDEQPASTVDGKAWDGSGTVTVGAASAPRTAYSLFGSTQTGRILTLTTQNKTSGDADMVVVSIDLSTFSSINGTYAIGNGVTALVGTYDAGQKRFSSAQELASGSIVLSNYNLETKTLDAHIKGETAKASSGRPVDLRLNGVVMNTLVSSRFQNNVSGKPWDGSGTTSLFPLPYPRTSFNISDGFFAFSTFNGLSKDREVIFAAAVLADTTLVNGSYPVNLQSSFDNIISWAMYNPVMDDTYNDDIVLSYGNITLSNYNAAKRTVDVGISGVTQRGKMIDMIFANVPRE